MLGTFVAIDWVIIAGFLALSLMIGILAGRRVSSLDDFLVAGRRLRSVVGIATLASTEMGLVTIVYFAEEAYVNGFVAIATGVIAGFTMWLIGRTGFVINRLRTLKLRTVPEYFETRFGPGPRRIAGFLTFLTGVLNMGIFLQVEGRFLTITMGLPSNTLPLIMGALLILVVVYTMLGGMYSVVITDVAQFVFIVVGIVFTTYFACTRAAGMGGMVAAVEKRLGAQGFNLWEAPKYGLWFLIWTTLYYISGWSSWQPVVQRVLSMKDVPTSQRLLRIGGVFMLFRACMPMIWGIAALAVVGVIHDSETALPEMLVRVLPAGLMGLVTVGFLSASMSTYDSYLLSFSTILVEDVVSAGPKRRLSERRRMQLTRLAIVVIAVFVYCWGVFYDFTETVFRCIALSGSLSYAGIITGLVGGIYWRRANPVGVYCAFLLSAVPPICALACPSMNPTHAGLLSFALAPIGLVAGSLAKPVRVSA